MSGVLETLSVNVVGEISDVTNAFNQLDQRVAGFGRSMQTMGSQLQGMGTSMSLAVTAPLMAIGGLGLKTAVDFDDAMRQVQAVTGSTGDSLDILRDAALRMGADTAFSSSQAAEAMLQLGQAGFSTDDILTSTEQVLSLASAGALDLGTAAGITANALMGFGLKADQTQRVVDLLAMGASISTTDVQGLGLALSYVAPVAHAMGMSIEETTSLIAGLSNAGIEGERAGTALRGSIEALARPTNTVAAIMAKYGISLDDVNPATSTFTEILGVLAAEGVTASDVMGIFGVNAGPGVLALLGQGTPAIEAQTAALTDSKDAAQKMADTMEGGAGGAIRQLQGSIETLQITIGDLIADALLPWIDRATELFNQLSSLPTPLLQNIIMIAGLAAAIGPALIAFGTLIKSTGTIITLFSGLPVLFGPIGLALVGIAAAAAIIYTNWDRVGPWLVQQFETLRGVALALMERVQTLVRDGFEYISNWWSANGRAVLDALIAAFQRTVAFITPVYEAVRNLVLNAFTLISNWWTQNGSGVMETLRAAFDRIQAAAIPLITTIRDLVERALTGISNWWTGNGNGVMNALNAAFTWIITTGSQLIAVALDLANRALVAISNWWTGSGQSAISALWQDLLQVAEAVRPLIPMIITFVQDSLTRLSAWWSTNGPDIIDIANKIGAMIQWAIENVAIPSIRNLMALMPTLSALFAGTRDFILDALSIIINVINHDWAGAWQACQKLVSDAWENTKVLISAALTYISGLINNRMSTIRADVGTAWGAVSTIITVALGAIYVIVSSQWGAIRTAISAALDAIRAVANTAWNAIRDAITNALNSIRTTSVTIWNSIQTSITSSLNSIRATAQTIWNSILTTITGALNNIRTTSTTIWNSIQASVSNSLNNIRTTASSIWNSILSTITAALNNIRTTSVNAWNSIQSSVTTSLNNIRATAQNIWNSIHSTITSVLNGIRATSQSIWASIQSAITSAMNSIRATIAGAWSSIASGVSSGWASIRSRIQSEINTIISAISNAGSRFYSAAASWVTNMINGLTSRISALRSAVNSILSLVSTGNSANISTSSSSNVRTGGTSSGGTGSARITSLPSYTGGRTALSGTPTTVGYNPLEKHDTGGIAGYTGWHWMEKDELAIPQATNWDAILINPISNALAKAAQITAGGSIGSGSGAGNVTYEGDTIYITANMSNEYGFDEMMDDINRRTTRDRFRRGIKS